MRQALIFFTAALIFWGASLARADVDHTAWDTLLKRYVDADGRVAYHDLKTKDLALFEAYLKSLAQTNTDTLSQDEEKALWINAYNAVIVKGVLDGHTAESLIARRRLFVWYTLPLAGQDRSPDDIEHKILRVKFNDPRIHFSIVCASGSCPKLRQEAYVAERLDEQLNAATRRFLNDPSRNQLTPQHLAVSPIFQWFAGDFVKKSGSVQNFIKGFVAADKQGILNNRELEYLDYDWTLNAQDGQRVS